MPAMQNNGIQSARYKADKGMRKRQMTAFFEKLERTPSGRLTRASSAAWQAWLKQEGLSDTRARQIMSSDKSPRPLNEEHVQNCIDYLTRHGYVVTKP
jgi:hypothetical protein